ncbi:hypothetical protein T484DRAFT_1848297 [Baffinella frigidus]|nr:hypothetical protein T484DRAFT_1848297 [Cryptophyta sp. CCMP2293]
MIGGRGLARCLLVLLASLGEVATFTPAFSVPCGKRFRIMTHEAPPFINVDPALCVNQRCPAAAFGDDGGLTYNFVTKELKVQLEAQCVVRPVSA